MVEKSGFFHTLVYITSYSPPPPLRKNDCEYFESYPVQKLARMFKKQGENMTNISRSYEENNRACAIINHAQRY